MMTATPVAPQIETSQPQEPQVPETDPDVPDRPLVEAAPPEIIEPDVVEPSPPDSVPDMTEITPPAPAQVTDVAPVLPTPEVDLAPPLPKVSLRPKLRPARRVAPTPIAPPEPDTAIDDTVREATVPDAEAISQNPQTETTAPEEAAREIVTEAKKADENSSAAPKRSARPKGRPTRSEPAPENNTAADALQAALAEAAQDTRPTGQPLSSGETNALRLAVSSCWNVGSLSSDALRSTVVVGFSMQENGKPVNTSIHMIRSTGGDSNAATQAYESARRAIIRCGARGYDLPVEKYEQWREIEMTFNPEKMRIK